VFFFRVNTLHCHLGTQKKLYDDDDDEYYYNCMIKYTVLCVRDTVFVAWVLNETVVPANLAGEPVESLAAGVLASPEHL